MAAVEKIYIQSFCCNKNKASPFPQWKQSSLINLPPDSWLIILGHGAILGTQCCICCRQIVHSAVAAARSALVRAISMLLSPRIIFTSAVMAVVPMPIGQSQQCLWKRHSVHKIGHPCHLII